MKFLIFDSGPLISLTTNGILYILEKLKQNFNGEFIITPQVKKEVIDRALKIKKYELEAIQLKDLLDKGILKLSSDFVPNNKLEKEAAQIIKSSNEIIKSGNEKISLLHDGEASCLAFARLCKSENLIAIDERTTRLVTESIDNLKALMERKLHTKISINTSNLKEFREFRYIRSSELVYIAYKKDLLNLKKDKNLLDALLYAVKFHGTAITSEEVEAMKSLA